MSCVQGIKCTRKNELPRRDESLLRRGGVLLG